ncbi:MAG: hypothetical protein IIW30_02005 [Flavobacteriales bacterium]|nr:hypothetical protein [Flavobacteriales bacterium]
MKAPKLPSFIRQNQHNTYTPRYRFYDPARERQQMHEKMYGKKDNETGDDTQSEEDNRTDMRDKFRGSVNRVRHVKKSGEGSSTRTLIIIIMALIAGVMWMLQTDWFEGLITSFMQL